MLAVPDWIKRIDKRKRKRYQITLPVKAMVVHRRKVMASFDCKTVDISSGGACLDTDVEELRPGMTVKLFMEWPDVYLSEKIEPIALNFCATSKVVRHSGQFLAVRFTSREFRTRKTGKP